MKKSGIVKFCKLPDILHLEKLNISFVNLDIPVKFLMKYYLFFLVGKPFSPANRLKTLEI